MTLGFVVQAQGQSLSPLVDAARVVGAGLHVVIDEVKAIPEFQALGAQIIYRRSDDDHAHENFDPVQFVERMHADAPAGALLHLGNEPGRQSLNQLNEWTLPALKTCDRLGRKGVCFNFATGEPEPGEWTKLRDAVAHAYGKGHIIGLHEYFDGTIARSAPWHVGRFKNVYSAFGAQSPQVAITELGCAIGYNPYAGWATYHTQVSYGTELVTAARQFYAPYGVRATVFLLGYWDRTPTFDVRGQTEIFEMMAAMNHVTEGGEMAGLPGWTQATTKAPGVAVNVRDKPSITGLVLATVRTGDWVKRLGTPVLNGGHRWQNVVLNEPGKCTHGWVSLNVIDL